MTRQFSQPCTFLNGASVLVTGGTGSFGKAFIRKLLAEAQPRRLIVFSRDELKQYEMEMELGREHYPALRYFIGDIRDPERLDMAMRGVDYVVHAAAMKHVTAAEYNPFECIQTNVHGAENLVKSAIRNNVKKVISLSTDKAVSPLNLYGASKLAADKIMVAANSLGGADGTRFAVVRYGNVVGSRGSVVPLYRRLVAGGAESLPITDPRMTRFWITLEQGVNFVLSSMTLMHGGEIFIPKIPSMRIGDLVAAMAPNLKTREIGIRPGEKLHEALLTSDDSRNTVELEDRYVIEPAFPFWQGGRYEALPGSRRVADGFSYSSDNNPEWLDIPTMRAMLEA